MDAAIIPSESAEQIAFVTWFRRQFPDTIIHSVPNGAHLAGNSVQRAAKMAKLKSEGLVPGIPDLHIPGWRLWIEMKRQKGGRLSEDQAAIGAQLSAMGDTVIVAKGWEDAKRQVIAAIENMQCGE